MTSFEVAEDLLTKCVSLVCGIDSPVGPLGETEVLKPEGEHPIHRMIQNTLYQLTRKGITGIRIPDKNFEKALQRAYDNFITYYSGPEQTETARWYLETLDSEKKPEAKAQHIAEIWSPELTIPESAVIPRWRLNTVHQNPQPIKPTEIMLQLNALYTVPEQLPSNIDPSLVEEWKYLENNIGKKIADYDHPVALFEEDDKHELLWCLDTLEEDIAFEKEKSVLPADHSVLVLLSISVTHRSLDTITERWVKSLLRNRNYRHIRVYVLSEYNARTLEKELFSGTIPVFSVLGKYGIHFNALKYAQLLFEKAYGVRAGFKLDTDEKIHSKDLYNTTGKTWFQVLCHSFWGGIAKNWKENTVHLDINEGEYINASDIEGLGYEKSLRTPDVKIPEHYVGQNLFFFKTLAHARSTALYNKFHLLTDFISHPVVKGGGFGITNDGLRRSVPFTLSLVGRAEDQQFYFCALSKGIRGIFQPDLRIGHYKGRVAHSEKKTAATRFSGDMYRLILFSHLADMLNIKEEIDPMPGIFAGPLAWAQAFFSICVKACSFFADDNPDAGAYLIKQTIPQLNNLQDMIEIGEIESLYSQEENQWTVFVHEIAKIGQKETKELLERTMLC